VVVVKGMSIVTCVFCSITGVLGVTAMTTKSGMDIAVSAALICFRKTLPALAIAAGVMLVDAELDGEVGTIISYSMVKDPSPTPTLRRRLTVMLIILTMDGSTPSPTAVAIPIASALSTSSVDVNSEELLIPSKSEPLMTVAVIVTFTWGASVTA